MTEENPVVEHVQEVSEHPAETVAEPVEHPPAPREEAHPEHHHETPEWANSILGKLDEISSKLTNAAVSGDPTQVETHERDESPVKPPWTHRKLFG